jgi:hypothetical protein
MMSSSAQRDEWMLVCVQLCAASNVTPTLQAVGEVI